MNPLFTTVFSLPPTCWFVWSFAIDCRPVSDGCSCRFAAVLMFLSGAPLLDNIAARQLKYRRLCGGLPSAIAARIYHFEGVAFLAQLSNYLSPIVASRISPFFVPLCLRSSNRRLLLLWNRCDQCFLSILLSRHLRDAFGGR